MLIQSHVYHFSVPKMLSLRVCVCVSSGKTFQRLMTKIEPRLCVCVHRYDENKLNWLTLSNNGLCEISHNKNKMFIVNNIASLPHTVQTVFYK